MIGLSANSQEALSRALGAHETLLNIIGVVLLIKTPYPLHIYAYLYIQFSTWKWYKQILET